MAQFKHYINVIDKFREFQENHLQLDYFGQGDLWEVNAFPTMTFPALWVNTVTAVPRVNNGNLVQTIEYTFNVLVFDLVSKGEQNELDVLNDTQLILIDLFKDMKVNWDANGGVDIINDPEMTPFTERFSDWVSGWNMRVVATVDFPSNYCEIATDAQVGADPAEIVSSAPTPAGEPEVVGSGVGAGA